MKKTLYKCYYYYYQPSGGIVGVVQNRDGLVDPEIIIFFFDEKNRLKNIYTWIYR